MPHLSRTTPLLLALSLALHGCASDPVDESGEGGSGGGPTGGSGGGAQVTPGGGGANFQGQGYGQDQAYDVAALGSPNDPNSPLYERIVYFDYDSSSLSPEYQTVVTNHARYLGAHPNAIISLEGHSDERGTREYNLALGERRAQAVGDIMVLQGASAGQIQTLSYGEERPAALGASESDWSSNRRVEIVYLSQ